MGKRLMKEWKTIGILWMKTLDLTTSQVSIGQLAHYFFFTSILHLFKIQWSNNTFVLHEQQEQAIVKQNLSLSSGILNCVLTVQCIAIHLPTTYVTYTASSSRCRSESSSRRHARPS